MLYEINKSFNYINIVRWKIVVIKKALKFEGLQG